MLCNIYIQGRHIVQSINQLQIARKAIKKLKNLIKSIKIVAEIVTMGIPNCV